MGWGAGAGWGGVGLGLAELAGRWCWGWGLRCLDIGLELGWDSHTFNENSKIMKVQFEAKFTKFLFILLLRV